MRENSRRIKIKVWNGEKLRFDLIKDYSSHGNFSYSVLNNITVEVVKGWFFTQLNCEFPTCKFYNVSYLLYKNNL